MKNIWILIVIGLVFIGTLLFSAGKWLVIKDDLKKSDVIIVISGDNGGRVNHAVKLFKENYADTLIVSGCPGNNLLVEALPMKNQAVSLGVPESQIIVDVLESHGLGTGEQAVNIRQIMEKHHFKTAILVTSNYHTRRAEFIFKRAFKGIDYELLISFPDQQSFNPDVWWKSFKNIKITFSEIIKVVWYWLTYTGK